jgi:hypothetical protein
MDEDGRVTDRDSGSDLQRRLIEILADREDGDLVLPLLEIVLQRPREELMKNIELLEQGGFVTAGHDEGSRHYRTTMHLALTERGVELLHQDVEERAPTAPEA